MTRVGAGVTFSAAAIALLVASAPAEAAPNRMITGKLSKPGFTVLALDANGNATAVETKRGKFKLRPPATRVSLHLRAPRGLYAGPIVVDRAGRKGRRAILGVEAGAELGGVAVRHGYAKLEQKLPREDMDRTRKARARKGVPIGAGRFGRVVAAPTGSAGPGRDLDRDGIPGALDIDDDGDLILDDLDAHNPAGLTVARGAAPEGAVADEPLTIPKLYFFLFQSVNANPRAASDPSQPAFSDAQIDEALMGRGPPLGPGLVLSMGIPSGGAAASTELDCGRDDPSTPELEGLSYCRPGGTGVAAFAPTSDRSFPECCDPDGDGFGTMVSPSSAPPGGFGAMELGPGATSAEIKTGQQLIKRVNDAGGTEIGAFTTTLQYVVATVPALASYQDTTITTATPASYPYAAEFTFPISSPEGQDVIVTLEVWRPQRRRIVEDPAPLAGESGTWMDIGGLLYGVAVGPDVGSPGEAGQCPQSAFSEEDPNLAAPSSPLGSSGGLIDQVPDDRPANPANTLTFTVNLSQCHPMPWQMSETRSVIIGVSTPTGSGPAFASQAVPFNRQ